MRVHAWGYFSFLLQELLVMKVVVLAAFVVCVLVVASTAAALPADDPVNSIVSPDPTVWDEDVDTLFPPHHTLSADDDPFWDMKAIARDFGPLLMREQQQQQQHQPDGDAAAADDDHYFAFRETTRAAVRRRARWSLRAFGRRVYGHVRRAAGHVRRAAGHVVDAVRGIFDGKHIKTIYVKLHKYVKKKFLRMVKWVTVKSKEAIAWVKANMPSQQEFKKQCDIFKGFMSTQIKVSKCTNGKATISWTPWDKSQKGGSQVQVCDGSTGHTYDRALCHYKTEKEGLIYFDDGPSQPYLADKLQQLLFAPTGVADFKGFNLLFWRVGQQHDYCYHHALAYPKHTRAVCDKNMLDMMSKICDMRYGRALNNKKCKAAAHIMYGAVRAFGKLNYKWTNTKVHYPIQWNPPPLARAD